MATTFTSLDTNVFLIWVVVKNKVHEINSHTVKELKYYISYAFTEIDGDRNLCRNVFWTDMKIATMLKVDILST